MSDSTTGTDFPASDSSADGAYMVFTDPSQQAYIVARGFGDSEHDA